MSIKALEETHTLNGNTLTIKVSEEDIDKVKRVMLDSAPWCRIFYEDGKDINVPSKEIIHCKDCEWWTKQPDSLQGRCALSRTYPTGAFFCGNARKRGEQE